MPVVANVDYVAKRIFLSIETVDADLDTLDVYREVRALRRTTEDHRRFRYMIEASGNVEKIAAVSFTPAFVRLLHGCRIVPYDVSHKIRLVRDTFTDDGVAGRDCFDRTTLSPAVDVDIDVDFPEIETRIVSGGSGLSSSEQQQLARIEKFIRNKQITDPATGVMTVYDDDGSSVLAAAAIYKDAAGAAPFDGTAGVNRRERLE